MEFDKHNDCHKLIKSHTIKLKLKEFVDECEADNHEHRLVEMTDKFLGTEKGYSKITDCVLREWKRRKGIPIY